MDKIMLTPYMVLPLFTTRFADYACGTRVSFIQSRLLYYMFSVYAQSGMHSRFNWWIVVVLTYNPSVLMCVEITDAPKL